MSSVTHNNKYENDLKIAAYDALDDISKMPKPVILFSGPISTGGFGSVSDNIECLLSFIHESSKRGISVFNQIAYERRLDCILKDNKDYDYPLLNYFYKPILESGKINGIIFLPLWRSSIGSAWEHDLALSIGVPIFHMENMTSGEIEQFYFGLKNKMKNPKTFLRTM
jgi:hypothetical protein